MGRGDSVVEGQHSRKLGFGPTFPWGLDPTGLSQGPSPTLRDGDGSAPTHFGSLAMG